MYNILNACSQVELLFTGGQKKVYKVIHPDFGVVVAKLGKFSSLDSLERIKREVNCLKDIESEYFPKNYNFEYDLDKKSFCIIEQFIDARNLTEVKNAFNSELKIVFFLNELVQGLKNLWERNIVHRDLKPDNILITSDLKPKIIDLGIARFLDFNSLTKTILPMGPCTPIYASPEQILNKKDVIDSRSDFFSLGIIILELYLGFHPFHPDALKNGKSIITNICEGNFYNPGTKGTSDRFISLVEKLLKVEPYQRFRNYKLLQKNIEENWR